MPGCNVCYDLDLERLAQRVFPHHTKYPPNEFGTGLARLDKSTTTCTTCEILRFGVSTVRDVWSSAAVDYDHVSANFQILEESVRGAVYVNGTDVVDVEYFTKPDSHCPISAFGRGLPLVEDPGLEESYRMINQAISECITSHTRCQIKGSLVAFLPKRLLNLENMPIRLHEPKENETIQYNALSHCWGLEPLLTLTQKRIEDANGNAVEFKWADLPKSFQHAAKVTRKLGIRYIWIDSLCIIQDDSKDWEIQSKQMGSIYERSYVTISATSAIGSTRGFLHKRKHTKFSKTGPDGQKFSVSVRRWLGKDHAWLLLHNSLPARTYPLLERGWCFQERLLATRVLHYTEHEMLLECNSGYRCECTDMHALKPNSMKVIQSYLCSGLDKRDDTYDQVLEAALARFLNKDAKTKVQLILETSETRRREGWKFLIELFSTTKLTYDEDVLPCLSALAQRMHQDTSETYIGGIWKEQIPACLLWQDYTYHTSRRPARRKLAASPEGPNSESYIAPSFSWASHVGRIFWQDLPLQAEPLVTLIDSGSIPRRIDKFGDLSSAFIELRGRMMAIQPSPSRGKPKRCKRGESGEWKVSDSPMTTGPMVFDTPRDQFWPRPQLENGTFGANPMSMSVKEIENAARVFLLRLYAYPSTSGQGNVTDHAVCLMLRKTDKGENIFKRAGIVNGIDNVEFERLPDKNIVII